MERYLSRACGSAPRTFFSIADFVPYNRLSLAFDVYFSFPER